MIPYIRFFLLLIISFPTVASAQALSIKILDVGEGQSVLLHKNNRAILIDTGHAGMTQKILQRFNELNIQHLDYLVLSHLHPDHASGYFRIHEAFPEANVLDNCHKPSKNTTPDMIRWVDQALEKNMLRQCVKAGDFFKWQGVELNILWPKTRPSISGGINHQSLVIQAKYRGKTLLVMGDADIAAELALIKSNALKPVDVLVVGHHGSNYASSKELLDIVQPSAAAISSNKNNFRGYPSSKTLQSLSMHTDKIYKTYEQGEIKFEFN